jgi:cytochrome c biogenesis protein CcmG/thiol:disulfide interchange protein DsbE
MLPLVILVGLVVAFWVGLHRNPTLVPSPLIGKPAPAFDLPSLANPDQRITSEVLKGQVSLVNVWASWCVACREEHPVLMAFSQQHELPIIGLDYKDQRDSATQWLDKLGDPYTTVAFDADGKVGLDWGVYGAPETYLVDADGVIRCKHIGPVTPDYLNDTLVPMVKSLRAGQIPDPARCRM